MKKRTKRNSPQNMTSQKKWFFSIITLLIPVLFFVFLECFLHLFHYGSDLSLFLKKSINGKSYYMMNPSVKNRYFSRFNFNPKTSPEFFLVSKPPGTFRIFCLGGSTTVGYPYWHNGAFSSFLRDRLKAIFPDRSIEIINVGMTATNSYTVLDFSADLLKYEPDLMIVYDGHNEFYGALGVASNERGAPARWMTLLRLHIVHFRTFQLVENIISKLFGLLGKRSIDYSNHVTMMERVARGRNIPYGSDVYIQGLKLFRKNLEELVDRCKKRHIPLFISTQVSNLRDQSPFISNNSVRLSQQQRSLFQQLYRSGLELQSKDQIDSAIVLFRLALELDSLYADVHYRLAQCYDKQGEKRRALIEYIFSRDYDELRFRTDSRFNDLIRSMEDHETCFLADIEMVFKSQSPDSLIGHDLMLEHLHPNVRGHFLIAKEYARIMRNQGLLASSREWARRDTVTDDFLWSHRHLTDLDELIVKRITEILTSGWPFKDRPAPVVPVKEADTLRYLAEQFAYDRISWKSAHIQAAEYYLNRRDYSKTEKEYITIINQLPFDVAAYLRLAHLYFDLKIFSRAEKLLLTSLQVEETPVAYRALGDIYLEQGKLEDAIHCYEELNRFITDPANVPENGYVLALAYMLSDKTEQAIRVLEQTIDRYPEYKPAQELLGKVRQYERSKMVR